MISTRQAAILVGLGILVIFMPYSGNWPGWDFAGYYKAARVFLAGGNPYNLNEVNLIPGPIVPPSLPYIYPPLGLYLFAGFAIFSLGAACMLYAAFSVVSITVSVAAMLRFVEQLTVRHVGVVLGVLLLGFASPLSVIAASQNGIPFEVISIALGTACLIQRRSVAGALWFIPSIGVKIQPLVLLILLLVSFERSRAKILACLLMSCAGAFILPVLAKPELFSWWMDKATTDIWWTDERDYSFLKFVYSYLLTDKRTLGLIQLIWQLLFLLNFLFLARALRRRTQAGFSVECPQKKCLDFSFAMFAIITCLISAPRLKPYTLIFAALGILPVLDGPVVVGAAFLPTVVVALRGNSSAEFHLSILVSLLVVYWALRKKVFSCLESEELGRARLTRHS